MPQHASVRAIDSWSCRDSYLKQKKNKTKQNNNNNNNKKANKQTNIPLGTVFSMCYLLGLNKINFNFKINFNLHV